MDYGFLRYEVTLVKADGSERVLENEATPHRCNVLLRRIEKCRKLGYDAKLRFDVSKIL